MKEKIDREKLIKSLRWHQSQLHHFLDLYFNKENYTEDERNYYKKFTDSTYRTHLAKTAELQAQLNEFTSEATF